MPLTDEQLNVIHAIGSGPNTGVAVMACAGSGKTSTMYAIAEYYKETPILLLTYSSKLKAECREKVVEKGITNLKIHSFHSFNTAVYKSTDFTDIGIMSTVDQDISPELKYNFDIIFVDEAQDLTPLLLSFVSKIIKNNYNKNSSLLLVGDPNQNLFAYNGSTSEFLINPEAYWTCKEYRWYHMNLSYSFRVPQHITDFLCDGCGMDSTKVRSFNKGTGYVKYSVLDLYSGYSILIELESLLDKYEPGEIFILSASVSSAAIIRLENLISTELATRRDVPLFIVSQDTLPDKKVTENKLVISSIHGSKGLERSACLIIDPNKDFGAASDKLRPEYYVSYTRSIETLVICQHFTNEIPSYVNRQWLEMSGTLFKHKEIKVGTGLKSPKKLTKCITNVLKNVSSEQIFQAMELIDIKILRNADKEPIYLETFTKGKFGYECVSSINGLAIPGWFEYLKTGSSYLFNGESIQNPSVQMMLRAATLKISQDTQFMYLARQIDRYNWIKQTLMQECMKKFDLLELSNDLTFEMSLKFDTLYGSIDMTDNKQKICYELKCVSTLSHLHVLQCVLYSYLWKKNFPDNKDFKWRLFNIPTGELLEINICYEKDLEQIAKILIKD